MKNKLIFTVLTLLLGGCGIGNQYRIDFSWSPPLGQGDSRVIGGYINGSGISDLGRDFARVVKFLNEQYRK